MRVFITGASGWIGSTLTRDLVSQGHEVVGLARSEESANKVRRLGASVVRGDMRDHSLLVAEAAAADAVAHLAFTLDFDAFEETVDNEIQVIDQMTDVMKGTGKAFFAASGTPTHLGALATEQDELDPAGPAGARARTARRVLEMSTEDIRSGLVRMPRTVHGEGDHHGLIANLVALDRTLGTAAYVGDGMNRWPAVHITDAGSLFSLALQSAPAGSVLHAVGEEGVRMRDVATAIAGQTGLAASAVEPGPLGLFGALLGADQPASSAATQALMGWTPTGPTLLEDLEAGYYTRSSVMEP